MTEQDLVGRTIAGKYLVKRLLGAGGMGAVFEGENVEIGKRVAIKVISASHAGSPEVAERFRREARAASKVESDNIVDVFDVGTDPVIGLYMVMEYLKGEDLAVRLQREKRLDVPLAVNVAIQAARALAKAHAAGVIHRDLKPANLFLIQRDDDAVALKILDFGISKLTADARSPRASDAPKALTRAGAVVGTAQYMSPEQAQGLPIDLRTDVWSLGAVLYEILAGQPAYAEMATYEQTIIQIVTRRPSALGEVAPWVPPELAALVHAALAPEIEARPADCGVLARRLAAIASDLSARPSVVGTPSSANVVIHASGADPKITQDSTMATGATAVLGATPVSNPMRGGPPMTPALTNDGVAIRSFVRAGPTRGTLAAILAGVLLLGAAGVVGIRALRSTPTASGIVAPPREPSLASPPVPEAVMQPGMAGSNAGEIAAEAASASPSASTPPPAPSATPTHAAAHAPARSTKPSDPGKTSGKAQIGSAGVDTQY